MKTINSYNDILKEGLIPSFGDQASLIDCIEVFINIQDELVDTDIEVDGKFNVIYKLDGYKYKISGYIENAKVRISGVYRYGGEDELEFKTDPDEFELELNTRNIYDIFLNKLVKIIKPI